MVDFKWAVMSNQIADCPVTVEDIDVAQIIWGKDIAALKGKTTRKKPTPADGNALRVPKLFLQMHKMVVMLLDIFFFVRYTVLPHLEQKNRLHRCNTPG